MKYNLLSYKFQKLRLGTVESIEANHKTLKEARSNNGKKISSFEPMF
jgi:hypothetical protein